MFFFHGKREKEKIYPTTNLHVDNHDDDDDKRHVFVVVMIIIVSDKKKKKKKVKGVCPFSVCVFYMKNKNNEKKG